MLNVSSKSTLCDHVKFQNGGNNSLEFAILRRVESCWKIGRWDNIYRAVLVLFFKPLVVQIVIIENMFTFCLSNRSLFLSL